MAQSNAFKMACHDPLARMVTEVLQVKGLDLDQVLVRVGWVFVLLNHKLTRTTLKVPENFNQIGLSTLK